MDALQIIAERRIREAIERGELDGLPGRGRPLALEDLSHVPEDLRPSYLLLRNAGLVPRTQGASARDVGLRGLLRACTASSVAPAATRRARLRFELLVERRAGTLGALDEYGDRLAERLAR
jgi:hypothetical protein